MSIGTLVGFLGGFGLIIGSILMSTDKAGVFINIPSLIMVLGGTFAAAFISSEAKHCIAAFKKAIACFSNDSNANAILKNEVGRIVRWGYIVQKNGLQGLEGDSAEVAKKDKFLGYGIDLVVTGYTGQEVRDILADTIDMAGDRVKKKTDVLKKLGGDSPAFGMIGTLIGLIIMLGNMGGDPSAIGPGMAVALITTLYGVGFARLVFIPLATKSSQREDLAQYKRLLITEGLGLLADRKSPRYIQDKMNSFLDTDNQYSIDKDMTENP